MHSDGEEELDMLPSTRRRHRRHGPDFFSGLPPPISHRPKSLRLETLQGPSRRRVRPGESTGEGFETDRKASLSGRIQHFRIDARLGGCLTTAETSMAEKSFCLEVIQPTQATVLYVVDGVHGSGFPVPLPVTCGCLV